MNHDQTRQALQERIRELKEAREGMAQGSPEREAASEAIAALRRQIDRVDVDAADALGARIDAAIADLEAVLAAHPGGAVAAIGRAVGALRRTAGLG